jgi:hypothetical protein
MSEVWDNQNDWPLQLRAWKKEAVEGAKEASLILGQSESLTRSHLRQLTSVTHVL